MAETAAFVGIGRRKTAVARVLLSSGSGRVTVNDRAFEVYFPTDSLRGVVLQPLTVIGGVEKYDLDVNVKGGGPHGQAGAVRHAVSRALLKVDAALRPALKAQGFLTRDPRMKERKKYGQPGARKRFQFSKR